MFCGGILINVAKHWKVRVRKKRKRRKGLILILFIVLSFLWYLICAWKTFLPPTPTPSPSPTSRLFPIVCFLPRKVSGKGSSIKRLEPHHILCVAVSDLCPQIMQQVTLGFASDCGLGRHCWKGCSLVGLLLPPLLKLIHS